MMASTTTAKINMKSTLEILSKSSFQQQRRRRATAAVSVRSIVTPSFSAMDSSFLPPSSSSSSCDRSSTQAAVMSFSSPSIFSQRSFYSTSRVTFAEQEMSQSGSAPLPNPAFPTTPLVRKLSPESQQKIQVLFEKIIWLDIVEISLLNQLYCFKVGLACTDDDGTGGNVSSAASIAAPEPVEEAPAKTIFDVKLVGYDEASKIKVIKEVRAAIPGLGLKEAKELVEGAPKVIGKDLKQEAAEELKQKLQAVGATVEII